MILYFKTFGILTMTHPRGEDQNLFFYSSMEVGRKHSLYPHLFCWEKERSILNTMYFWQIGTPQRRTRAFFLQFKRSRPKTQSSSPSFLLGRGKANHRHRSSERALAFRFAPHSSTTAPPRTTTSSKLEPLKQISRLVTWLVSKILICILRL